MKGEANSLWHSAERSSSHPSAPDDVDTLLHPRRAGFGVDIVDALWVRFGKGVVAHLNIGGRAGGS